MDASGETGLPLLLTSESAKQYFYNLLENPYSTTHIPILSNKSILGSAFGWLVLLDYSRGDCCIWNPTSMSTIQLPELEDPPYVYNRCVMSKPPTDPDCFIIVSKSWPSGLLFSMIGDNAFSRFNPDEEGYRVIAITSLKGIIYGIIHRMHDTKWALVTIRMAGAKLETTILSVDGRLPYEVFNPMNTCYLVKPPGCDSDKDFLLVTKTHINFYLESGVKFRVFRVDEKQLWEEIDNLDGRTIFISKYGDGLCRCSKSAIKPNCIYYTNRKGMHLYVYDLGDCTTIMLQPYPGADIDPSMSETFWVDIPNILSYAPHL